MFHWQSVVDCVEHLHEFNKTPIQNLLLSIVFKIVSTNSFSEELVDLLALKLYLLSNNKLWFLICQSLYTKTKAVTFYIYDILQPQWIFKIFFFIFFFSNKTPTRTNSGRMMFPGYHPHWIGLVSDTPCNDCSRGSSSAACTYCRGLWRWTDNSQYDSSVIWHNSDRIINPKNEPSNSGTCAVMLREIRDDDCASTAKFICKRGMWLSNNNYHDTGLRNSLAASAEDIWLHFVLDVVFY